MSRKKKKLKNKIDNTLQSNTVNTIESYDIFKFLKPNENTNLSALKGLDLQDLLILLDEVYLTSRDSLGLDENVTFGLEIEIEHAMRDRIKEQIYESFPDFSWECDYDGSLDVGLEINSPVLKDTIDDWKNLKKVCQIIRGKGKIDTHSGGHIHVGAQILDDNIDSLFNFISLWSIYENIIYRFLYGEFLTPRPAMKNYAQPVSGIFYKIYKNRTKFESVDDILDEVGKERYQAVNFSNIDKLKHYSSRNTIEFRAPNGSLEPVIWQNNVNLCVKLLEYSNSNAFDFDMVNKRYNIKLNKFSSLEFYNEIYIEQALELCDMLFDNNLDKVYFLRQYFKSFDMPKQEIERAKTFVLH